MDFPHLSGSTQFPGVQNVDPYRFKNTFDYNRWDAGTTLKLLNVAWSKDDGNVVKFEDDKARDNWFDEKGGRNQTLESQSRVMSDSSVKVPLPYDECSKYNYLMVDLSTATSPENPIDYETKKYMSRYYFFVLNYEEIAPSTTRLFVSLDYWTTYINRIKIGQMTLERGHAPMAAAADVDTYLECPINNTEYLLADDYDFGKDARRSVYNNFIPYGAGEKYILLASTINAATVISMKAVSYQNGRGSLEIGDDAAFNNAVSSYSSTDGIVYTPGSQADATINVRATPLQTDEGMSAHTAATAFDDAAINGYTIYMAPASLLLSTMSATDIPEDFPTQLFPKGATYLDYMIWAYPHFAESIKAMWVVPAELLDTKAPTIHIGNDSLLPIQVASKADTVAEIKFKKEDFAYEEPYDRLTKLYTSPYATVVFSDNNGKTVEIGVERTAPVKMASKVSIAYPCLKFTALLEGVDSDAEPTAYQWKSLAGEDLKGQVPSGSFYDFMFTYDIPTFALFESGYVNYALHNYNALNTVNKVSLENNYESAVRQANVSQLESVRSADTDNANALNRADTSLSNTNKSADTTQTNANASASNNQAMTNASSRTTSINTKNSANTAYDNAITNATTTRDNTNDSADTALSNTNASAATTQTNTNANADLSNTNTKNSTANMTANQQLSNATSIANTQLSITNGSNNTEAANGLMQSTQAWDAGYSRVMQDLDNQQAALTNVVSGVSGIIGSGVSAAASLTKGDAISAASGLVGASVDAVANTVNVAITAGIGKEKTEAGITNSQNKLTETANNATEIYNNNSTTASNLNTNNNNLASATTKNNVDTTNTNADNTTTTTKANSKREYDTATSNASANNKVTKDNAARTFDSANTTATASKNTATSNANNTERTTNSNAKLLYDVTVANAGRNYTTTTENATATNNMEHDNAERSLASTKANALATRSAAQYGAIKNANTKLDELAYGALDKQFDAACELSSQTGDYMLDEYGLRGLTVRLKTERPDEYKQAGDIFFRYGYAYNRNWIFRGFNVMEHFAYWKCSDVWLVGSTGVIEDAQQEIRGMLLDGVTVWSNPDEVGSMSIYENNRRN